MAGVTVRLDLTGLNRIEKKMPGLAEQVVRKLALDTDATIKANFSPVSPSRPGDPPGVDTGTLKNSIVARPRARLTWVVQAGTEYAAPLEFGTMRMAARPYFRPAFERVANDAPREIKRLVRF